MSQPDYRNSGITEAIILIKAAPQVGKRHGETVCCAAIDLDGNWLRLYPVSFRYLEDGQKFRRWDRVKFSWSLPKDDRRPESRRISAQSLTIVGKLAKNERQNFLSPKIVTSLDRELEVGHSLALLSAEIKEFYYTRKTPEEIEEEAKKFNSLRNQNDLFNSQPLIPFSPCNYSFKYRYVTNDGPRDGTCQDWEIEATFFKWSKLYGEQSALDRLMNVFGDDYIKKGMLLAMGTHSRFPDTWLINGVIRLDEIKQLTLF